MVDAYDIITCVNFGEDRLRGLGWREAKFCHFPLTLIVVLTTISYYRASVW